MNFETIIADYFQDQARDYTKLLASNRGESTVLRDKFSPASTGDSLLTEKFGALAWLVRCHTFVPDIWKANMINAFRNSEITPSKAGKNASFHSK